MKKHFIILCLLLSSSLFAQDYHWSTNHLNRAVINPAENALDSGMDATIVYRNQWKTLMTPFSTLGLNINSTLPKGFGIGLTAVDDKAGSVGWHRTNVLLNLNYGFEIKKILFRFGAGFGVDQYSVDPQKALFPDQINPDLTLSPTSETFIRGNVSEFDNTAGLFAAIPIKNTSLELGINVNHFLANKGISYFGNAESYSDLWSSYASLPLPINPNWHAKPYVSYLSQGTFQQVLIGSSFHYAMQQHEFFTSMNYRLGDALIGQAGVKFSNFRMGISYDYTISSIRSNASNTGAAEIFAGYHFKRKQEMAPRIIENKIRKVKDTARMDVAIIAIDKEGNSLDSLVYEVVDMSDNSIIQIDSISSSYITWNAYHCMNYTISIAKKGYLGSSKKITAPCISDGTGNVIDTLILEALALNKDYTLANIYYAYNKTELKSNSKKELRNLFTILQENPTMIIELSSHTDNKGSNAYNQKLSEERAKSCVNYLIELGISANRLNAKGYGESMPIEPNENPDGSDNPLGREKNRRTEFKILEFK